MIDETCGGVNDRREICKPTLESNDFRLNRTRTGYNKCKFSVASQEGDGEMRIDTKVIPT